MKSLSIAILLTFAFAGSTVGQSLTDSIARVRQIKLLQSTRDDVKRILREYDADDDEGHDQDFSKEGLRIEVMYSSGTCSDDSEEEDASEIWSVKEWTVTRIEIQITEPVALGSVGMNLAPFKKEPRFAGGNAHFLVLHNKDAGIAAKTTEGGIETLIFFPPRASSKKLCRMSSAAKGFYIRKGWFSQARPSDDIYESFPAKVTEINLSAYEIGASSAARISVRTVAIDPENDVLTYKYFISAGKIIGTGANVTWDLTDVSPGSYTITATVDDGCGLCGTTVTKTVVVK
nr:hypothetical protein [uncultured bacterium]